jgi:hypothetical protein
MDDEKQARLSERLSKSMGLSLEAMLGVYMGAQIAASFWS